MTFDRKLCRAASPAAQFSSPNDCNTRPTPAAAIHQHHLPPNNCPPAPDIYSSPPSHLSHSSAEWSCRRHSAHFHSQLLAVHKYSETETSDDVKTFVFYFHSTHIPQLLLLLLMIGLNVALAPVCAPHLSAHIRLQINSCWSWLSSRCRRWASVKKTWWNVTFLLVSCVNVTKVPVCETLVSFTTRRWSWKSA